MSTYHFQVFVIRFLFFLCVIFNKPLFEAKICRVKQSRGQPGIFSKRNRGHLGIINVGEEPQLLAVLGSSA